MNRRLVPDGFQLPELLENEHVRLRMLTPNTIRKLSGVQ